MSPEQLPKLLPGQETRAPDDCELFLEGILEARRGQRTPWQGGHYSAPYKSGPTASQYPCGNHGGHGSCGNGNCGNGSAAGSVDGALAPMPPAPADSHAGTAPADTTAPAAASELPKDAGPATLPPLK